MSKVSLVKAITPGNENRLLQGRRRKESGTYLDDMGFWDPPHRWGISLVAQENCLKIYILVSKLEKEICPSQVFTKWLNACCRNNEKLFLAWTLSSFREQFLFLFFFFFLSFLFLFFFFSFSFSKEQRILVDFLYFLCIWILIRFI